MSFFSLFYQTLYKFKVMAYSRLLPITKAILHVTITVAIACLPFIILLAVSLTHHLNQLNTLVENELPPFTIQWNELISEQAEPTIEYSDTTGYLIFDPQNDLTLENLHDYEKGVAIQKNGLVSFDSGEAQEFSYAILGIQEMTSIELKEQISNLTGFLPVLIPVISVLIYAGLLGLAFLGISILAFLGPLLKGKRTFLTYKQIWNISAFASTTPIILYGWLDPFISLQPIFLVIMAIFFIFIAIRQIPLPKMKSPPIQKHTQ
ncbi:hypothetical protein BTS2_2820 [Bacillus sp. TS-2]|nr:hypothetical protein BTS2_2820 [Bacillus sp. TS-2]